MTGDEALFSTVFRGLKDDTLNTSLLISLGAIRRSNDAMLTLNEQEQERSYRQQIARSRQLCTQYAEGI